MEGVVGPPRNLFAATSIHALGSAIVSLDSRSVRCCVSELFESFIDLFLTAMAVAEFDVADTYTLSVLDDLHVSQATWNAIAHHHRAQAPLAPADNSE